MKRLLKGVADRVGLYHVAHKAQGHDDRHRKEARQKAAEPALEPRFYVVDRTAGHLAVHRLFVGLGQRCLRKDGRHAEKGGEPHPKNRARAAGGNGRGRARDIAGAHLGRHCGRQRLERAHARRPRLVPAQLHTAENPAHPLPKTAHLHEFQPKSKIDSRTAE